MLRVDSELTASWVGLMRLQDIGSNQMGRLFILPYRPEDWTGSEWTTQIDLQVEPNVLAEAIKNHWPEAEVQVERIPYAPVEWAFPSQFMGCLLPSRDTISFTDGPKQSLIEFVPWYRTFIGASVKLFLLDEGSDRSLELTAETSTEEITDFVGY